RFFMAITLPVAVGAPVVGAISPGCTSRRSSNEPKGAITMKRTMLKSLPLAALVCVLMATANHAQQVPIPTTAAQVPGPATGTAMTKPYVQMLGRIAYFWGWPLVNAANRAVAFSKAPEPGWLGSVVPVAYNHLAMLTGYIAADQHFIACPN